MVFFQGPERKSWNRPGWIWGTSRYIFSFPARNSDLRWQLTDSERFDLVVSGRCGSYADMAYLCLPHVPKSQLHFFHFLSIIVCRIILFWNWSWWMLVVRLRGQKLMPDMWWMLSSYENTSWDSDRAVRSRKSRSFTRDMKLPQNQQNQHWLVVWNMTFMTFMTFHILGMSSQMTFTPSFFGVAKNHQPECIHGTGTDPIGWCQPLLSCGESCGSTHSTWLDIWSIWARGSGGEKTCQTWKMLWFSDWFSDCFGVNWSDWSQFWSQWPKVCLKLQVNMEDEDGFGLSAVQSGRFGSDHVLCTSHSEMEAAPTSFCICWFCCCCGCQTLNDLWHKHAIIQQVLVSFAAVLLGC